MQIKVDGKEMLRAVKAATLATDKRSCLPILSSLHLKASNGTLTIRGTDLNTEVSVTVMAYGEIDCAVPAKQLGEVLTALCGKGKKGPSVPVDLALTETMLSVGNGTGATMKIVSAPSGEFPAPRPISWENPITYMADHLLAALEFVAPAISADETRYHLNGACFTGDRIVATDGHRLHMEKGCPSVGEGEFIVPRRAVNALGKIAKVYGSNTLVACFAHAPKVSNGESLGGEAVFEIGVATVAVKLIEAKFPPVDQVIPTEEGENTVEANTASLTSAVKTASLASSDKSHCVKFSLAVWPETCEIKAENPDTGECTAPFVGKPRSAVPFEIGVNGDYLLDFLAFMGETVNVEIGGRFDPLKIVNGDRTVVVMPVRI